MRRRKRGDGWLERGKGEQPASQRVRWRWRKKGDERERRKKSRKGSNRSVEVVFCLEAL